MRPDRQMQLLVSSRRWTTALLFALFAISAALCVRAMRWDRWANYENTHRPWMDGFGGESYSSFKAWRAWRTSWNRAVAATVISSIAIIGGFLIILTKWRRGMLSRWMITGILVHALPLAYFIIRWGPDFDHPAPAYGG